MRKKNRKVTILDELKKWHFLKICDYLLLVYPPLSGTPKTSGVSIFFFVYPSKILDLTGEITSDRCYACLLYTSDAADE